MKHQINIDIPQIIKAYGVNREELKYKNKIDLIKKIPINLIRPLKKLNQIEKRISYEKLINNYPDLAIKLFNENLEVKKLTGITKKVILDSKFSEQSKTILKAKQKNQFYLSHWVFHATKILNPERTLTTKLKVIKNKNSERSFNKNEFQRLTQSSNLEEYYQFLADCLYNGNFIGIKTEVEGLKGLLQKGILPEKQIDKKKIAKNWIGTVFNPLYSDSNQKNKIYTQQKNFIYDSQNKKIITNNNLFKKYQPHIFREDLHQEQPNVGFVINKKYEQEAEKPNQGSYYLFDKISKNKINLLVFFSDIFFFNNKNYSNFKCPLGKHIDYKRVIEILKNKIKKDFEIDLPIIYTNKYVIN